MNWIWQELMPQKLVTSALLCVQMGLLWTLAVAVLTFLADVLKPVAKEQAPRA